MQLSVDVKISRLDSDDIGDFLRTKMDGKIESHGRELRIQDAKARDVKQLLHKYLHQRGLDIFRVEVVHPGIVEVLGPEPPKPHFVPDKTSAPPFSGANMPWLFPSSPVLRGRPDKKQKKQPK